MFKKITDILKAREKIHVINASMPRHIAITMEREPKATKDINLEEMYNKRSILINKIVIHQQPYRDIFIFFNLFNNESAVPKCSRTIGRGFPFTR